MTGVAELAAWPAVEMVRRFADRSVSPVEVHEAVQAVIAAREADLNAFWVADPEESGRLAAASERRWMQGAPLGPIDGVPVTCKENVARRGVPMPAGTAAIDPVLPTADAPITTRIAESGGVLLGSTVMPDWGMLSSGVSSRHGVTRSPWNRDWTTGGSSSGAGASAAGGYGPLHVGTDIGGSIRLPGGWLGLATLKPSYGRIPLDAPYLGRCAGPMARTVADAALFMGLLSRPDARDFTSLPPEEIAWTDLDRDVGRLRVGLHLDAGCGKPVEPEIAAAVREAATSFEAAGATVETVDPFIDQELLDGVDLFLRVRSYNDFRALTDDQQAAVHPFVAQWCRAGADAPGHRVLECYQQILQVQDRAVAATLPYDIVLSPVAPGPAFGAEQPMPYLTPGDQMAHIGFTVPYNMSGQPAATLNCGFTADGRPIGVQISGRRFDDLGVLRAAHWYERHRPVEATPKWPDDPGRGRPEPMIMSGS